MTNRDFKVGDRVFIRSWEDMKSEFGGSDSIPCRCTFIDEMKIFCGVEATITKIFDKHTNGNGHTSSIVLLRFEEYDSEAKDFNFSTDMIELADILTPQTDLIDEFVGSYNLSAC